MKDGKFYNTFGMLCVYVCVRFCFAYFDSRKKKLLIKLNSVVIQQLSLSLSQCVCVCVCVCV